MTIIKCPLHIIMLSNSSKLENVVGENWLAVGDAAATHDPISSRGIVTAISNGIYASSIIKEHLNGKIEFLEDYSKSITTNFFNYLKKRAYYYGLEKRWIDSVFWKRNQDYPYKFKISENYSKQRQV